MAFTLELTPAQEARLRENAALIGVEPAAMLLVWAEIVDHQELRAKLIELFNEVVKMQGHRWENVSDTSLPPGGQEWQVEAERFRQWADSHRPKGPGLSLDAMSRESIYGEHG